jgi:hypothetical protein
LPAHHRQSIYTTKSEPILNEIDCRAAGAAGTLPKIAAAEAEGGAGIPFPLSPFRRALAGGQKFFAADYKKLTLVNLSHNSSIESNSMSGSANSAKKVVLVPRFKARANNLPFAII